jgi:hypothetical protein
VEDQKFITRKRLQLKEIQNEVSGVICILNSNYRPGCIFFQIDLTFKSILPICYVFCWEPQKEMSLFNEINESIIKRVNYG